MAEEVFEDSLTPRSRALFWIALVAIVLWVRLSNLNIVWVEEAYGLAAAREILNGKVLYRDLWFDKPPLYALFYVPVANLGSLALRLWGTAYVVACAAAAARLGTAPSLITPQFRHPELLCAGLIAFFLSFDYPAMTIALAPDLLMVLPHLLAVNAAMRSRHSAAGFWCAICLMTNVKAVFVVAAVLLWSWNGFRRWLLGFGTTIGVAVGILFAFGAWPGYLDAVWKLGSIYAADSFVVNPLLEGSTRTLGWVGFHIALFLHLDWRKDWRSLAWLGLSAAGAISGFRFFPRYYFQPLVPAVAIASRSIRSWVLLLLLIPLIRFGGRYVTLTRDLLTGRPTEWADLALSQDSQRAASQLSPGTLLVWGYRPEIFVFARGTSAGSRWIDSQMLTGVFADRHLSSSKPSFDSRENRRQLTESKPDWIVDGIGPLNPDLAITRYPDLQLWLADYREVRRTKTTITYRRVSTAAETATPTPGSSSLETP